VPVPTALSMIIPLVPPLPAKLAIAQIQDCAILRY
jgi:hypothetical protein